MGARSGARSAHASLALAFAALLLGSISLFLHLKGGAGSQYSTIEEMGGYSAVAVGPSTSRVLTGTSKEKFACDRPWPELELFLPINTKLKQNKARLSEWKDIYLRTMLLFWPLQISKTSLLLLLDSENRGNEVDSSIHAFVKDSLLPKIPGGVRIAYNDPSKYYSGHGHDRQQLIMFWADNFTSAEYVGFVDTDCLFLTYIDREDLFENGKPVVNARTGNLYKSTNGGWSGDNFWRLVAQRTYETTGIAETMRCMSYFPVIIKTAHMKAIRERIVAHFNYTLSFDDIFRMHMANDGMYSQFNVFCTVLFENFHDEYIWYVHDVSPEWDHVHPPPAPGQNASVGIFDTKMYLPKPRIASHANYRNWGQPHWMEGPVKDINLKVTLQQGVCFSPPLPHTEHDVCRFQSRENEDDYFEEMHSFEMMQWDKGGVQSHEGILRMHKERNKRIAQCNHTFPPEELATLMTPIFPDGRLIGCRCTGKSIWKIQNDTVRQFPDWDTFVKMGYDVNQISEVTRRVFLTYRMGRPLPSLA